MNGSTVLDGFALARSGGEVAGTAPIGAFQRAADLGAAFGAVRYQVLGTQTELAKPALRVVADGAAEMTCQRCLEPVDVTVTVDAVLELATSQAAIDAADDDVDRVVAAPTLDVLDLIEDELILALPMVARHDGCVASAGEKATAGKQGRQHPFAALAARAGSRGRESE
jgi:uncharacterized protein